MVYRKETHTDQYLNFGSHHPLNQKLGVIRTLLDCCESVVTEKEDQKKEKDHIRTALERCGYPQWACNMVVRQRENKTTQKKKTTKVQRNIGEKNKGQVVLHI